MKLLHIAIAMAGVALLPSMVSAKSGEALYKKKCKVCHSLEAGKHGLGPSLAGIVGKTAGQQTGYTKYKALVGSSVVWTPATLESWLSSPAKFTGQSTSMPANVKKVKDRAAIIEYLKTQ